MRALVLPDSAAAFAAGLQAIQRRILIRQMLHGAAAAILLLACALVARRTTAAAIWWGMLGAAMAVVAIVLLLGRKNRTRRASAHEAETSLPSSRNLVVTAAELLDHPERAGDSIRSRVFADAVAAIESRGVAAVVPLRQPGAALACAALLAAAGWWMPLAGRAVSGSGTGSPADTASDARMALAIELTPPAYTGRQVEMIAIGESGGQIAVLAGTRARLRLTGDSDGWQVRFGDRTVPISRERDESVAELVLSESGYIAAGPPNDDRVRLIAVSVTPDRSPSVRIERPGRDLMLPGSRTAIDVAATATDDLGLGALALRYTKVSGSGEQFEFEEGELPLQVARDSATAWRGQGRIPLERLGLEAGDSLVYRVIARDGRPGAEGTASSDTFFIEIAGPGQVPLEGIEMPPEQERYALSQQMIVVKIQRLRDKAGALTVPALTEETAAIAAEQRSVRANFVFLMGGHVEDEVEEAEHSSEIQEGRLENTGRQEVSRAVSHMGATEQGLVVGDTATALAQARLAVQALQRAFGRSRYLLRALPSRSRIDPARRLSGALDDVRDAGRLLAPAEEREAGIVARTLVEELLGIAPLLKDDTKRDTVQAGLTRATERALAAAAGNGERWRQVVADLLIIRSSAAEGLPASEIDAQLRRVVLSLVSIAREGAIETSGVPDVTGSLRRTWTEGQRK